MMDDVLRRIDVDSRTSLMIDQFAAALKAKLTAAERKYGWLGAWMDEERIPAMRVDLRHHVEKGDPLDVAAYAAFLWYHGESTNAK